MKLSVGDQAPGFSLPDQDGRVRSLADYRGSWLLIYFYPKDDTPGCTAEACALRDSFPDYARLGLAVVGISADATGSHARFAAKNDLPFPLLSDEGHQVLEAYSAWQQKKLFGRLFIGIARISFLVDPDGRIARIYESVKPAAHAGEVLSDTIALS